MRGITSSEAQGDPVTMAIYALAVKALIGKLKFNTSTTGAGICDLKKL